MVNEPSHSQPIDTPSQLWLPEARGAWHRLASLRQKASTYARTGQGFRRARAFWASTFRQRSHFPSGCCPWIANTRISSAGGCAQAPMGPRLTFETLGKDVLGLQPGGLLLSHDPGAGVGAGEREDRGPLVVASRLGREGKGAVYLVVAHQAEGKQQPH